MNMSTITAGSTISVHLWNLSAYVSGNLVGDWIDLDSCEDLDDFRSKVGAVTRNAEEFILSDYESDCGIAFGELTSLDTVWEAHEFLCTLAEYERDAFGDYLASVGGAQYLSSAITDFPDKYRGQWKSIEEYALDYAEQCYSEFFVNVPPGFRVEVEVASWECDVWISDNGHVFDRY
jgi:antirestriction protein